MYNVPIGASQIPSYRLQSNPYAAYNQVRTTGGCDCYEGSSHKKSTWDKIKGGVLVTALVGAAVAIGVACKKNGTGIKNFFSQLRANATKAQTARIVEKADKKGAMQMAKAKAKAKTAVNDFKVSEFTRKAKDKLKTQKQVVQKEIADKKLADKAWKEFSKG